MDYVLVSDFARYYVVIVSLWLIAVLLRLAYTRIKDAGGLRSLTHEQDSPHAFSMLGLAVVMAVAVARRFDTLGEPGDVFLWVVFVGVTLVLIGVLINVRFSVTPPWRRR